MKKLPVLTTLAVLAALASVPAQLSAQVWTDWTQQWVGTLSGITVTYTGNSIGGQTTPGTDYWSPSGAYTQGGLIAPTNTDFIQFNGPVSGTVSFSSPVLNPYFALISVGQSGRAVTYDFGTSPFAVLSNNNAPNCAFWGCGSFNQVGNTLAGTEFSGTLQFIGTYSSISFTTNTDEFWHGMTVGADGPADVVPEPASMTLLATGLAGLAAARKRRKSA